MVTAALEALVGTDPDEEVVFQALTTIPAAELGDALRLLARTHGRAAVPVLAGCLRGRPEWAAAAATALGLVPCPETATALARAEATAATKTARTAVRRALYRLRQAGVAVSPAPAAPPPRPEEVPEAAWASGIDGTGSRGIWLVVAEPLGARLLVTALVNDTVGVVEASSRPMTRKRLDADLRRMRSESPLPWVAVPPPWALALLEEAARRHTEAGTPVPPSLAGVLERLRAAERPLEPPVYDRLAAGRGSGEPDPLERSAELLGLPELAGWVLDPAAVHADAVELLQARESRLVVSAEVRAEREAALVDRVADAQFGPETRRCWHRRLEEEAWVLLETSGPEAAHRALAVARALADAGQPARRIPFVRALVERSLAVAGEVALGRLPAQGLARTPRAVAPAPPGP